MTKLFSILLTVSRFGHGR